MQRDEMPDDVVELADELWRRVGFGAYQGRLELTYSRGGKTRRGDVHVHLGPLSQDDLRELAETVRQAEERA